MPAPATKVVTTAPIANAMPICISLRNSELPVDDVVGKEAPDKPGDDSEADCVVDPNEGVCEAATVGVLEEIANVDVGVFGGVSVVTEGVGNAGRTSVPR